MKPGIRLEKENEFTLGDLRDFINMTCELDENTPILLNFLEDHDRFMKTIIVNDGHERIEMYNY